MSLDFFVAHVMLKRLRVVMRAVRIAFAFGICAALSSAVWSCSLDGGINPQPLPPDGEKNNGDDDGFGSGSESPGAADASSGGIGDAGTAPPDSDHDGGKDGDAGDALDGGIDGDGGDAGDALDGGDAGDATTQGDAS